MLGKLIKYDFAATWKVCASLDAVLIVIGFLAGLLVCSIPHIGDSFGLTMFVFSGLGLFYIGIIAANVIAIIYLVIRYYRNLYTSEGYLTFTLPVKTDLILHSKVITGSVWMFLSYLCTIISMIIAGTIFINTIDVPREDVIRALREVFDVMGFNDPSLWGILVTAILIVPIASVLCMYFCVSMGQLWQSHKVLGAVLCVVGLHIVNQIASQIVFLASGFWNIAALSTEQIDASFGMLYRNMMTNILVFTLFQSVIYYVVCIIINRKKINLD